MGKKKWELGYHRKYEKKWVENPGTRPSLQEEPRKYLQDALDYPSDRVDLVLVLNLEYLATWEGHWGSHRILEGDIGGWVYLKKTLFLLALAACLRRCVVDRRERLPRKRWEKDATLLGRDEPNGFVHGIAFREDAFVSWLGDKLLLQMEAKQGGGKELYHTPYIPFVLKLYSTWKSKPIVFRPDVERPLGLYEGLFTHWNDLPKFTAALHAACDYHCIQSFDNSGFPEFTGAVYGVCPMEIIALKRIRMEAGSPFPEIDHPLLKNNPFLDIPAEIPPFQDELVSNVANQLKADYPEIDCL